MSDTRLAERSAVPVGDTSVGGSSRFDFDWLVIGMNPSLTIAALDEHAISHIPAVGAERQPTTTRNADEVGAGAHYERTSARSLR